MGHFSQLDPLELQPFPDEEAADLGIFGNEGSLFSAAVGVKSFMQPLKWLHPHLRVIWVSGARIVNAQNWHCFHLQRSEQ